MSRFLLWFSLLLCAVIVVIGASLQSVWLRDRILAFALDAGTEHWSLESSEGRLLTGIVLEGLSLEVQGVDVSVGRIEVRPGLARILFGQIALKALVIDELHVRLPETLPEGDPDAAPADIRLPLPLVVDRFSLHGFHLIEGSNEVMQDLDLAFALHGSHQTLEFEDLRLGWPEQGLLVGGRANVDLDPLHAFGATLNVIRSDPTGALPPLETQLTAIGSRETIGLTAKVSRAVTGTLVANWDLTSNRGRIRGDISAVAIDGLPEELTWQSLKFDAEGSPEALAFDVALDVGWDSMQPSLRAHGSVQEDLEGRRLQLDHAELSLDANAVELRGGLALSAPFGFQAELTATDLDLSSWLSDFPTRLDVTASMDGELGSETAERHLELRRVAVNGHWNEAPARLRAAARLSGPDEQLTLTLDRFDFELGDNHIDGRAALTESLDLDLDLALNDLQQLWPDANGALRGRVSARGTPTAPDLNLDLALDAFAFGAFSMTSGLIEGRLSLDPATPSRLDADIEGLASGDLLAHATARIHGNWPRLSADLGVDLPEAELEIAASASADVATLGSAELRSLSIDHRLGGRWQLEHPMQISRSEDTEPALTWRAACLFGDSIGQPSLCLSTGQLGAQGLVLDLTLTDLAVESFATLLPEELLLNGAIHGEAQVRGSDIDASLTMDGGRFRVLDSEDSDEVFADAFSLLRLDFQRRGTELTASLEAQAELMGGLDARGGIQLLPDTPFEDAPLTARVRLDMADLTPFGPLLPGIGDTGGTLVGDVTLSGRVGDPELSGSIELDGRMQIQALALELDPVTLSLNAKAGQAATLRGRFHAGSEVLELDAEADWDMDSGFEVSGRLLGDALPLAALPDLDLTLSPDLRFALDDSSISLNGSVTIPEARARISALPQGGGDTLSKDVVIHRPAGTEAAPRRRDLYLNLSVILGDDVHLSAAGLESRLTGRLQLLESPGAPMTAQGRLETREGSFKAYGQDLELRTGRLNFDGPLDNPAVNVLAVRRVESAEVGVQVGGFLNALETRLYASPARDEVDTLTMLITGKMPGEANSAELANVSDAALNFGIGRAVPVVGKLVNRLGIDELAVDSPLDEEAGAVVVGTQLTDDIYVRYTYRLHSRLGGLQIEYRVTDWLSVQSETGTTQAIDLIFRHEFN